MPGFGTKISQSEANAIDIRTNLSRFLRPRVRESYDINAVPAAMVQELNAIEADAEALTKRVQAFIASYNKDQAAPTGPTTLS